MLKEDILSELEMNSGTAVSGQALANKYNVTRNSIWKAINSLKKDGYNIISSTNRGYQLACDNDIVSKQGIKVLMKEELQNIPIYVYQTIDSTNSEAKRMLANDDSIIKALIISDGQDKGRSRHSGGFYSPEHTGIYMSLIYKVSCQISNPKAIAVNSGNAVINAVNYVTGVKLTLNDQNDIYYNNRKAGGIFTEAMMGLETGITSHVIIGIGMNISTEQFPEAIADKAIALSEFKIHRNELIAAIANEIFSFKSIF